MASATLQIPTINDETVFSSSAFELGSDLEQARAFIRTQVARLNAAGATIRETTDRSVTFEMTVAQARAAGWTPEGIAGAVFGNLYPKHVGAMNEEPSLYFELEHQVFEQLGARVSGGWDED